MTLAIGLAMLEGCAAGAQMIASDDDLADYRTYRVAAHEGTRLARAQKYLVAHPHGTWAAEVRAAFDDEEPAYFERLSDTRKGASDYLSDLPRGPHADAAIALLTAYDTKVDDVETANLMREARRSEAMLDRASADRRAVSEAILSAVGAFLDPNVYGARIDDAPAPLLHALAGTTRPTWGRTVAHRDYDLYFTLPTRPERESRVANLVIAAVIKNGVVEEGMIEGPDLFVHWDEADQVRALDPTSLNHRAAAAFHAKDLLTGAMEARVPASRCEASARNEPGTDELIVRRCDGWTVVVTWARRAGDRDRVVIRGPAARNGIKQPP